MLEKGSTSGTKPQNRPFRYYNCRENVYEAYDDLAAQSPSYFIEEWYKGKDYYDFIEG